MLSYFTCLRPLNLAIIALSQILIFYTLFLPLELSQGQRWVLSPPYIFLFTFITMLIAAAGYLINDYFDFNSDLVNRKKYKLPSKQRNLNYYFILVGFGFCLSLGFAIKLDKPHLALIFIAATGLLFLYSTTWKKKVLIGNLVVALFSAFVMLIILYAEQANLAYLSTEDRRPLLSNTLIFSLFAFLISMVREIVKDIEDMNGDKIQGYNTMPISWGIHKTRQIVAGFCVILILVLFVWHARQPKLLLFVKVYGYLVLIIPSVYILYELLKPKAFNATKVSKMSKVMMLNGLLYLILLGWN